MTRLLILVALSLALSACKQKDPNPAFDSFKESFIEQLWEVYPWWASNVGYHRYDSAKLGDDFNLKSFHEKFLSYGSAPVKYIRTLMLSELDN